MTRMSELLVSQYFLETFDLTDTYHICFPQSGYFNVEIPFQGHQGHCRACGLGSYALRLTPKTGYDCDCSSVYATMVASQHIILSSENV